MGARERDVEVGLRGDDRADAKHRNAFALWAALPWLSFGAFSWLPFAYLAVTTRERRFKVAALAYLALVGMGLVVRQLGFPRVQGLLFLVSMLAGAVHVLTIRNGFMAFLELRDDKTLKAAERAAAKRDKAQRLAQRAPKRARELGVGRPDLAEAFDGGVVDVNHAPFWVLATLPGLDDAALRARVVEAIEACGPFSSLDDFDLAVDLPRRFLADMRLRTVFLPD